MAVIQYWINYVIFFQNEAEYNAAIAIAGSNLLEMTPRAAGALFGIPFPYPSGDMSLISKGIYFVDRYGPGSEILFPNSTGVFIDDTILTKVVTGQAGNPPSIWPAGPDGSFTWSGNIVRSGGGATIGEPTPTAIPQRRWIFGREIGDVGEGADPGFPKTNMLRDSSRTIDGFGWSIRGNNTVSVASLNVDIFRTGLITRVSWERFYVRVRRLPSVTNKGIWRCTGLPSGLAGCRLKIETDGTVRVYSVSSVGVETLKGILINPIVINKWYKIDILLKYGSGATDGRIAAYVNGVLTLSFADASGSGMGANTRHTLSELGDESGISDAEIEVDFDDWMNADLPANCDPSTLLFTDGNFPIDWLIGSHIRSHYNDSVAQVNWTPAAMGKGVLNQHPGPDTRLGTSQVSSATSGATIEGLSDALDLATPDTIAQVVGAVAAIITDRNTNSGSTDGQLGYRKVGAAAVLVTIDQTAATGYDIVSYLPTGMLRPDEISPWSHTHTKSVDGNTDVQTLMLSAVEYIGIWGIEDSPTFDFPISRLTNLHNCRYGNSAWGYLGSHPDAPVYAIGGTYIGNGIYQEITLPAACHFLWIRATSGAVQGGHKMFGASLQGHIGGVDRCVSNVRVWYDFGADTFKFSVVGDAGSEVNDTGITYQYIAFCDPGMRFNLCGAFGHGQSSSTPKINPLIDSSFLADFSFFQSDLVGSISNVVGLWAKGPGFTGNAIKPLTGAALVSDGANLAAGIINSFAGLHPNSKAGTNYSLWRMNDSGVGGCAGVMIQALTYTGNGVSPRNITLTPTSGRFPLLTIVVQAGAGTPIMRDPSHTGANSCDAADLSNTTTGITALAIDQITVSSSLNANGTVYSVFVICGGITNTNGVFIGDYCAGGGPYIAPTPPLGNINIIGSGGLILSGAPSMLLIKDKSGIYTIVPGKTDDTVYDRQTGQTSVDLPIPDPTARTGFV